MTRIFEHTTHRPYPMPPGPWVMAQSWHELLFAHWPIDAAALRPRIPARLQIDTFNASAWMGVVPFRMSGVRLRGMPPLPGLSAFPELNVRTYVTLEGKPGVWFFSLDAASALAVSVARAWFHLPYFNARMRCESSQDAWVRYRSERNHRRAPSAEFRAGYRPNSAAFHPQRGTLEYFLTERYCLYAARGNRLYRGEIHHPPWLLQNAEAEIERNTMAEAAGFALPQKQPLLHYAAQQDMVAWAPQRIA